MRLTGGCLCGQVRYAVEGEPVNVRACHCAMCRKVTGGPFFLRAIYPRSAFSCEGETARYRSSERLWRAFCPACGASLFAEPVDFPDRIAVSIPTLDEPDALRPQAHVWTSARIGWICLDDGAARYPERAP